MVASPDSHLQASYPLSPLQQGMLFKALLTPNAGVNIQQVICRLGERMEADRLEKAWSQVVERHDVFRTRFRGAGLVEPVQEVLSRAQVAILLCDLSGLDSSERNRQLERYLTADRARGFDLAEAPAMRLILFRLSPDEHVLVWTVHHILLDAGSSVYVMREVLERYDATLAGVGLSLPTHRPFRDHIAWLQERDAAADEAYWTASLRSMEIPAPLLGSRQTTSCGEALPSHSQRQIRLAPEEDAALRSFKRLHGVNLNILGQAAWAVLLGRLTGREEAVFGLVRGGRSSGLDGAEAMVGLLVNTVPVRVPLPAQARVGDWLKAIANGNRALRDHEHSALPDITRWAGLPHGAPLFNTTFNYQTALFDEAFRDMGGRWAGRSLQVRQRTGYALSMGVSGASPLCIQIDYDDEIFDAVWIDAMLRLYRALLLAMAAEPEAQLRRLPLVSPEEREVLLAAGRASASFPVAEPVHARFERHAAERPDAPALTSGRNTLSYGELNARANRLTHRLRTLGVAPEVRVGIALERSAEMIVAILAVLKAGGAYVPIDPAYPADRIHFVLKDAGIPVLVTTSGLLPRLPAFTGAMLLLDTHAEAIARESVWNPPSAWRPDHLAYVIYTSGSTGAPKGVQVTHANVLRLFDATDSWFGFGHDDVWTLFHSCAFDFSVWEIWGALFYGGRLVVVPFLTTRSPEDFHRLIVDERVTVLSQTPSAFKQLILADRTSGVEPSEMRLRCIVFGGEALDPQALRPWIERHGDDRPRLVNMYGITETTVHVTYRRILRADLDSAGSPIGMPIPDLDLHVLDANLEPVPVGVPGELFVGGAGVARGYLDRPELTAERFLRDPFSQDPAARLYRSGDLARRRPDGDLDYLGRADQQVKVRGFRIEIGEIEAAVGSHPAAASTAVVVREDTPGDKRLVAYVVVLPGLDRPTSAELRAHASEVLPDYMVPAAFVLRDALPLTGNGKLDRRALPAPEEVAEAVATSPYAPPRTDDEAALAEVWAQVLGVERIGLDDNYFALGGDSIRSLRLIAAAHRRGFSLSIPQLYRYQTVRELAASELSREPQGFAGPSMQPFALLAPEALAGLPEDVEDAYPASRVQLGMLYHTERDPGSLVYHEVLSVHVHTHFDEPAMRAALQRVAERHPILRTSFDLTASPEPVQRVHRRVEIPLEVTDLSSPGPSAPDAWMAEEKGRGFDWRRAPLIRFHAHRLPEDSFRLVLVEHHAVLDGWSVAALTTEILRLFVTFRDGQEDSTGAPPIARFRDFVELEREAMASREARTFWRRVVDGAPAAALPPRQGDDAPRPDETSHLWIEVLPALQAGLRRAAERAGVPLKTVLLAAYLRVLAQLSGADEVVAGYVTSGRPETEDGERVLGVFLNTVPLRVKAMGGTWGDLLRHTWAAEQALLPHRRFPLSEIVREAGGRTPFEAAFNFVHFHVYDALAMAGVRMERDLSFEKTEVPLLANIMVMPGTGELRLRLEHDSDRLGESQVRQIAAWLTRSLEAAATAEMETPLRQLPFLSPEEREVLLAAGRAVRSFPAAEPVHVRFERHAAERPDAPALTFGRSTLSYGELNARADRLAHRLRTLGVAPEVRVGIALERSPELIVAILAVLKAGGAYVPLDPSYPADRIRFVLEDARIPVLLTTSGLLPRLPAFAGATLLVDTRAEAIARESSGNPDPALRPDHLAYVIYTSGSTGSPKGVQVTHANVLRLFEATDSWFGFGPEDVWTLFHSCAFDFSVWEIWGALLHGGRLVVVPFLTTRSPEDFHRLIIDERVTVLSQTPSAFKQLILVDRSSGVDPSELRLRHVVFGGEALDPQALRPWIERHGEDRPRLVNMYGITETTVHVTYRRITGADLDSAASPIGAPISDLSLHVLDRNLEPVPVGVPGELFVGGAGVARGYLNRPELTAERFLQDPFSTDPAARLYRSGDLARRRSDGELEYLGRADQQVKVRGFRIEIGEIEAAVGSHPAAAATAVILREDTPDDRRLVAYVVVLPGLDRPTPAELRAHASEVLPDYMVPAAFVLLEAFPLTENGKLDRRALPAPEQVDDAVAASLYAAPRTDNEMVLAEVWAQVLGVERVGVDDNYFALGGDSIRAVQMVAVLRSRGMMLTVRNLHQQPTIRGMAEHLDAANAAAPARNAPVDGVPHSLADLGEAERSRVQVLFGDSLEDVYPAARMQTTMLHAYERDAAREGVYHPQQLHRLTDAALSIEALRQAIEQVVRRHSILRTVFTSGSDGTPLQVVRKNPPLPIDYRDLRNLSAAGQERAVQARVAEDLDTAFDPFDPAGSLIRFTLFHRGNDTVDLLISAHHAIEDGWGNVHFLNSLFEAYGEIRDGRPVSSEPVPNTYREFVALEAEILESEEARAFWEERRRRFPAWPLLRGEARGRQGESGADRKLSPALTAALRATAAREGVALKAVYLSAFLDAVAAVSGTEEACVGVVWNGRSERLSDPLTALGLFWNLLPIVRPARPGGTAHAVDRIKAVHEEQVRSDLFGRYPLSAILETDDGREPFFATFNFLQFRNWAGPEIVRGGRVELLSVFDRFHLPFNLVVSLAPHGEGGSLHVEYDGRFFARDGAEAALDAYLQLLRELASEKQGEV